MQAAMPHSARIGPNALIQMVEALRMVWGPQETQALLASLGLGHYADFPPQHMLPQEQVTALHTRLFGMVDAKTFKQVSREAGFRTADYLLAHRIPAPVQAVLRHLPDALAARLLCAAIAKHAWTFAGSGVFSYHRKPQLSFRLQGNPLCSRIHAALPVCDYYAATFERLFRVIVNPHWRVQEMQCEAHGAPYCEFVFVTGPATGP